LSETQLGRRSWVLPSAEVLTVGLPFCAFKLLTALVFLRIPSLVAVGYALIGLGLVDLVFNVLNLVSLVIRRRRASDVCLTDFVLRRLSWGRAYEDLGIAIDVLLSFGLVALVIGAGMLLQMPRWALPIWNVAVVLNVLGAGIGRLLAALQQRPKSS
jgi:hypothetical protein